MKIQVSILIFPVILGLFACKNQPDPAAGAPEVAPGTPVTVTTVSTGTLQDYIELNATSTFLLKSYVKSNVNGYLQEVNTHLGEYVKRGQRLFTLKTKESETLGNSLARLDSTLRFAGAVEIAAPANGYVTQLNYQTGDYVQDGEQIALISDAGSAVFLLEMPYELRPYLAGKTSVNLTLPDGTVLPGRITAAMPSVDPVSQTQSIVIRPGSSRPMPENLIATVRIVKNTRPNACSLPKPALLTDETQSTFWVMKMLDDSTAVKVPVRKGIETADRVEILSPRFAAGERILLTGNYGLPDTAKVFIVKE